MVPRPMFVPALHRSPVKPEWSPGEGYCPRKFTITDWITNSMKDANLFLNEHIVYGNRYLYSVGLSPVLRSQQNKKSFGAHRKIVWRLFLQCSSGPLGHLPQGSFTRCNFDTHPSILDTNASSPTSFASKAHHNRNLSWKYMQTIYKSYTFAMTLWEGESHKETL